MNTHEYTTKDFYLGACILASGIPLLRLEQLNHKSFVFVFSISPENANNIISQHWNKTLVLPTRSIVEAITELKTRIYSKT